MGARAGLCRVTLLMSLQRVACKLHGQPCSRGCSSKRPASMHLQARWIAHARICKPARLQRNAPGHRQAWFSEFNVPHKKQEQASHWIFLFD